MSYRPSREESENIIHKLATDYPKCFFEDPKLRQPLKKSIMIDLEKEGLPVARELLEAAVDWYQSHFAYQYALEVGVPRLDLHGKKVSTVTELEYRAAQKKIEEDKQRAARDFGNSTRTLASLHEAGRIPDDQLRKLDAPPMPVTSTQKKAPTPEIAPELSRLYEALNAANTTLATVGDAALRSAMASAALAIVIKETQRVVASFQESQGA
jgi:sRNA-binding protein